VEVATAATNRPASSDMDQTSSGGIRFVGNSQIIFDSGDRVLPSSAKLEMRLGVKGQLDHPLEQLISGKFREIPEHQLFDV
jgi:hypothetical protein